MATKPLKLKTISIALILLLASILRLWNLGKFPAGLNADEAAIGYNAYSLLLTGRDEHGHPWPLHFESFGDYKPGFYFYLVLPLVKLLGLNVWAVRLPSALLGIFSVWLIYLLTQALLKSERAGKLAALLLAISPWHLHFSRGGWETNAATFFILAGVYLFLKALDQPRLFIFSFSLLVFSMYTYHSARVIVPLLGGGLLFFYRQQLFNQLKSSQKKWLVAAVLWGLVLTFPLLISFLGPAGVSRFSGVGLLADTGPFWRINELRGQHSNPAAWSVRLLHNRFLAYGIAFAENWLDHFHGEFLFVSGDVIERNRVPETGQLYLFQIPLVVLGIYLLLSQRPANWPVVFLWLAVAPVAAAMTFQTPHALRAHNMVIPLTIISAYGFSQLLDWVKNHLGPSARIAFYLIFGLVVIWQVGNYLHQYYLHYPRAYPTAWEEGFEPLVNYLQEKASQYDKIYVTDRYDQPYILFLFYLRYPPARFQQEGKLTPRDRFGFSTVRDFGKFHFEKIEWEKLKTKRNILVVGTREEIPESAPVIKTIYFSNHQPAFLIAKP